MPEALKEALVHSHLFRYDRVRQLVRRTKPLPLASQQTSRSRLPMAYLPIGDDETRELLLGVPAAFRQPTPPNRQPQH